MVAKFDPKEFVIKILFTFRAELWYTIYIKYRRYQYAIKSTGRHYSEPFA